MEPNSVAIVATSVIFTILAAGSLGVRFWTRKITSAGYAADDWFAAASFGFSAALALTNILGVPLGSFGSKFEMLTKDQAIAYLKFFFVIQFWYVAAVAAIKLTVLFLYKRIFSSPQTPMIIWILIGLTIGWAISFLAATLFQILPIWCNWIACTPTTNYPLMYLMSSVTDLVLDIVILCLPILFIRNLHMRLAKKIGIAGIFGLGLFCIVASTARLYYTWTYMQANITGDYASNFDVSADNFIMWSGIEACVSTTCANLPTYGSIITAVHRRFRSKSDSSNPSQGQDRKDNVSRPPIKFWAGMPISSPLQSPISWQSGKPSLLEMRSMERLPSIDERPPRGWKHIFNRTMSGRHRDFHATTITSLEGHRHSGTTCPVDIDHDCHHVVHQVVEMSVVRTSRRNDAEFCILPCSPVEAAMRIV